MTTTTTRRIDMYEIFKILLQIFTDMSVSFKEVTYRDEYLCFEFTDVEGKKYSCLFRKED